MSSYQPPTYTPYYASNEQSIPRDGAHNPPPFAMAPQTLAQPTASNGPPSYPQYSNSYGYVPAGGPQKQDADSQPSFLSYLRNLSAKDKKRLYWIVALVVVGVILLILFEVYRSEFETWILPATNWLTANDSWSWAIPTAVLIILSFPPLFGHEIVMLFVGLAYPIGVGIGIACAGAILGEAACFIVFKYFFTSYVDKKIAQSVRWAATAKVSQEAGFRGVLIIRYSIVPPHLANPLFSCTGMPFWIYMTTVVLSLPKTIIFVILSSPDLQNSTPAKLGKYAAITVLVAVTIFASRWIGGRIRVAIKQIELERAGLRNDEESDEMLRGEMGSREGLTNPSTEMGPLYPRQ